MNITKNKSVLVLLAALSLTTIAAPAEEAHHQDRPGAATGAATPGKEKNMATMQEQMLNMHAQMHKIMDAKSPQEREKLMQEHSAMMHKHMEAMRGGMMSGGGMTNKKSGSGAKGEAATQQGGTKPDEHQH